MGDKIGYVRVSTEHQNTDRQEIMMERLGVDKVFIEKASGKNTEGRPELQKMLDYVREGDVVIGESLSRFARSTRDFLMIYDKLEKKGVKIKFLKESFIDTTSAESSASTKLVMTIFAALSEFEREQMLERQKEGIEAAQKRGVKFGRPKLELDQEMFKVNYQRWVNGEINVKTFMNNVGINNRNTLYSQIYKYEDRMGIDSHKRRQNKEDLMQEKKQSK